MKAQEGGITVARKHLVKGGHQGDAGEEGDRGPQVAGSDTEDGAEGGTGLGKDLQEGHLDHHPGGEAQREGEQAGIEAAVEQTQQTADAGGQSGEQRQQQGKMNVLIQARQGVSSSGRRGAPHMIAACVAPLHDGWQPLVPGKGRADVEGSEEPLNRATEPSEPRGLRWWRPGRAGSCGRWARASLPCRGWHG